ncbi:aa3-type cytochrome c oxidase subunit IV [Cohaesibacter celericrescens]|uniref:Aa3-type cytochrome c oxidase subunit IV n=1 Tax=Cohaesibacter celericrescens TaxID=2067669 RepID=A0A2N5XL74_9HYPH|nr:aa3-type cytochrome c oxidase subunit IV [Cohaesibacter celericrescens]PLW75253.1 aa3-type cytochrome c oxidase subunit IV [Cohaesibacter celericrescens]
MADKLNPVMDYDEHNKTYDRFIAMFKYGTIVGIVVLVFMAITLL